MYAAVNASIGGLAVAAVLVAADRARQLARMPHPVVPSPGR